MLSVLGALLFLTDCIAICVSNISGGPFSTSCLAPISSVCALLRKVLRSASVAFRRS